MATYNLIKNDVVVNTIEADQSFIDQIKDQYDEIVEVVPPVPEFIDSPETDVSNILPFGPNGLINPDFYIISPVQFKLLFTSEERVAIKSARTTDPVIDDFFDIIDDPRLSEVNLKLTSTIDALKYLVTKNLITEERKNQILNNFPQ